MWHNLLEILKMWQEMVFDFPPTCPCMGLPIHIMWLGSWGEWNIVKNVSHRVGNPSKLNKHLWGDWVFFLLAVSCLESFRQSFLGRCQGSKALQNRWLGQFFFSPFNLHTPSTFFSWVFLPHASHFRWFCQDFIPRFLSATKSHTMRWTNEAFSSWLHTHLVNLWVWVWENSSDFWNS